MTKFPCTNPKCPNTWHHTQECPNAPSGAGVGNRVSPKQDGLLTPPSGVPSIHLSLDPGRDVNDYLVAAIWTSEEEIDPEGEKDLTIYDLDPESRKRAEDDYRKFVSQNADDIAEIIEDYGAAGSQIGHDFWLTRNHHGAGFWDRGYGEAGERLSRAAEGFGEIYLIEGDDGALYLE